MSPELEAKLIQKYPEVFKDAGGDPAKTCMAWGIAVGDGWFDIIDVLCAGLVGSLRRAQAEMKRMQANLGKPNYGGGVIDEATIAAQQAKIEEALAKVPVAAQVKEKFGGLRFYVDNGGLPEQRALIEFAEAMSERTCEMCGGRGMPYPIGWVRTLCPEHADQAHGEKAAALREQRRLRDE